MRSTDGYLGITWLHVSPQTSRTQREASQMPRGQSTIVQHVEIFQGAISQIPFL